MHRLASSFAVLALLASAGTAVHAADDLPKRKPGLWEMKSSMAEMGGLGPTMQICVGEQSDQLLSQAAAGADDKSCTHKKFDRDGNRISVEAVCKMEGTTATIRSVFTGDFTTAYKGEIRTTYNPPLQGMASTTMKQEGRWLGPCKAGQKPGDVTMQGMPGMGGTSFNVEEAMKNLQRRQGGR